MKNIGDGMYMIKKKPRISLKLRIFLLFFGIFAAIIIIFILSFFRFVSKSTYEKMDNDYSTLASDLNSTSQNLLWKLTLSSQQLLDNDDIQENLMLYEEETDPYIKQTYYANLLDLVTTLTQSETDIALYYFYSTSSNDVIYSSLPIDSPHITEDILYQNEQFKYYGPTNSQSSFITNPVFMLNRTLILPDNKKIFFSIETGYYSLDKEFNSIKEKSAYVVFTNSNGEILYNTLSDDIINENNVYSILNGSDKDFHVFSEQASQGWCTYVIVPNTVYTSQYQKGLHDFTLLSIFFILLLSVLALLFWKSIYRPLEMVSQQLNTIVTDQPVSGENPSNIPEFDFLFSKIKTLQEQVQQMVSNAVIQEKQNTHMQLDKLRAQINPHFLMNTLNTVHWLALMNNQHEIDDITQALSHLLSYNLDKDSYNTNLQREIDATNEYVKLQKIRYDFDFNITLTPANAILSYPCPKFILQPFVENAISHGYRPGMSINIDINIDSTQIIIKITDSGAGMSEEALNNIIKLIRYDKPTDPESLSVSGYQSSGKGIGLSYVIGILKFYFNENVSIDVRSTINAGTEFCICIPKMKGRGYDAENTDN